MDYRVAVEAGVAVYDIETEDEAIRVAIAKTGDLLNPGLSYVEIDPGVRESSSGEELSPVFVVADEALVALELKMDVFNADTHQHAERITLKEIGQRITDIPLTVLTVEEITEEA